MLELAQDFQNFLGLSYMIVLRFPLVYLIESRLFWYGKKNALFPHKLGVNNVNDRSKVLMSDVIQEMWFVRYRCDTLKVIDVLNMQHFKIRVAEKF